MSINLDTSNETHQGPPDGTQGYLAACYRNIVDTKPSHFSKPNPESDRKSNRKPEKEEWTEPKIKSPNKEKKNPRTLYHVELLLGLIDVVQGLH